MSNIHKLSIGERIRKRREELGYSQEELARMIGYTSRSTINKIESGRIDIAQSKIEKFSKALDIPPVILMGWDYPIPPKEVVGVPDLNDLRVSDKLVKLRTHYVTDIIRIAHSLNDDDLKRLWEEANNIKKNG